MGGIKINKFSKVLGAFTGSSADPLLTSNATTGQVDTATNTFGSLANGNIWIGNASNVPIPHFITGDITIANTGVAAIGAGVIVNGDISAVAAISLTKLAPVGFSLALVSDGSGFITTSATTAIQVGYLSTTTSDVQVQLNGKSPTITGAASTVVTTNLTPSIVAVTNGAGKFTSSATTVTVLGFINNLTSDAQVQLNSKLTVALGANTLGDLIYFNGGSWTNFPIGAAGQVLTTTGGGTIGWAAATANGLPVGGTGAQFLAKNSGVNFDASWFTLSVSLITDILATAAQINASTTYLDTSGVPIGTNGQALTISGGTMVWSNVGTGTVTSIDVAGGTTGLVFTGGPITAAGTITLSGTLGVVNGGTNQTAVAVGDLLYGSGVNTWSRLTATTNGFVLTLSGGVPVWAAPGGGGGGWSTSGASVITGNTSQSGAFTNTSLLNSFVITQNNQSTTVPSAFVITGGAHTSVAAVTALTVTASTGATNNYAATFMGGNIGIGTTTPTSKLHVTGTNGNFFLNTESGGGTAQYRQDSGSTTLVMNTTAAFAYLQLTASVQQSSFTTNTIGFNSHATIDLTNGLNQSFTIKTAGTGLGTTTGNIILSNNGSINVVVIQNMPTSSAGRPAGTLWNNAGVVNIV